MTAQGHKVHICHCVGHNPVRHEFVVVLLHYSKIFMTAELGGPIIAIFHPQLSFNKMLESQIAQLAATVPSIKKGKIPGKPEDPVETVKLVTTRFDKPSPLLRSNWGYLLDSPFITKKEDPGHLTIECLVGPQTFYNAFSDLGSGVNIMSKVTYDNLLGYLCSLHLFVCRWRINQSGSLRD